MTRTAVVLRNRRLVVRRPRPQVARAHSVRVRVGVAWGLLVLNTLTWYGSVLPVPHAAGQLLTQLSLPAAIIVALSVNRRVVIRPNVFLCLASLLVVDALITVLQPQYVGNIYRTVRLVEFVFALWLLTPWWGRRDLLLLRATVPSATNSAVRWARRSSRSRRPHHGVSSHRAKTNSTSRTVR